MKTKTSTRLYNYWNDVRGTRIAPHRFEIEPAQIADVLAHTFILERTENHDFRFRLAGTQTCDEFGREFRGHSVLDLWRGEDRTNVAQVLRAISLDGAMSTISLKANAQAGWAVNYEMVLLPLVHIGDEITRILGAISVDGLPPSWLTHAPIKSQTVRQISVTWPDGKPASVAPRPKVVPTVHSKPEHIRVVKVDRRSFRVFDGGRAGDNGDEKPELGAGDR